MTKMPSTHPSLRFGFDHFSRILIPLLIGIFLVGFCGNSEAQVLNELKNIANNTPSMNDMKKRISQLHQVQASYLKKVTAGEVDPVKEQRDSLTKHTESISVLKENYTRFLSLPVGSQERSDLGDSLHAPLSEFGFLLQFAEHPPGSKVSLNANQTTEMASLQAGLRAARSAEPEPESEMQVVGSNLRSTLLFLPVPISVRAPKGGMVYFESVAGGVFENGMPLMAKKVGDDGLVHTFWISKGDGVADCRVSIACGLIPEDDWLSIRVVAPIPVSLPAVLSSL